MHIAWYIFRYDFQSRGRTMEHQIACFFMSKQALNIDPTPDLYHYKFSMEEVRVG